MVPTSLTRAVSPRKRVFVALAVALACLLLFSGRVHLGGSPSSRHRSSSDNAAPSDLLPNHEALLLQGQESFNTSHQVSAPRPPRDPIAAKQCDTIPSWYLHDLATEHNLASRNSPSIFHFHDGRVISDEHQSFDISEEFCSVVFAPQNPRTNASEFQNEPIEGWGPDSIHAEMSSDDIRFIFVRHPEYWGILSGSTGGPSTGLNWALYTLPFALYQPGSYQVSGEVEFTNYDWVMEDPLDLTTERLPYQMKNITLEPLSPPILVTGRPVSRPTARCYYSGHNDLRGRWYRATSFAEHGNQTALNPAARLEYAEHNLTTDEWGWTFAPDQCSMTYFSPEDHLDCLANRSIQVLGDSNSRRVIKSIMAGGIAWCQDPSERLCQCEDHFEEEFYDVLWNQINASKLRHVEEREEPTIFGRNSKFYFDFVGGAINSKVWNVWSFFFATSPGNPSIVAKRMETYGPIDVVHVSFIGWDMAAVRTPSEMVAALPEVKQTLQAAYPPGTRFIHRLANNNCCGNSNYKTRYSAPRFAMWNHMWRTFWADEEEKENLRVVDPSVLQGRRDAEEAFLCPTTHLRASHVRIEQQMWMGAVCEKVDGKARIRNS